MAFKFRIGPSGGSIITEQATSQFFFISRRSTVALRAKEARKNLLKMCLAFFASMDIELKPAISSFQFNALLPELRVINNFK